MELRKGKFDHYPREDSRDKQVYYNYFYYEFQIHIFIYDHSRKKDKLVCIDL